MRTAEHHAHTARRQQRFERLCELSEMPPTADNRRRVEVLQKRIRGDFEQQFELAAAEGHFNALGEIPGRL